MSNIKSKLSLIAKILVAVALIAFMVHSGHLDLSRLWSLMTVTNIALALLLSGLGTWAAAWRWIVLVNSRGLKISFNYGVSLYLIGMFFNYALPGSVSGDLVRGYYLVQDHPERKMDAVLSILIDRVLGVYSFFILTLFAVACDFQLVMGNDKLRWMAMLFSMVFVGMTVFFVIGFSERLTQITGLHWLTSHVGPLHKVMMGFQRYGQEPKVIFLSVAVSLLSQFFSLGFFYQVAVVMGETDVTWQAILFAVPMGFLVTAVPIAPAGVGVGQVAFLYLFNTYLGHPTQFGATSITAFQLALAFWALVGAIFYVRRSKPNEFKNLQTGMQESLS